MRELLRAALLDKPIVTILETEKNKGGLTQQEVCRKLLEADKSGFYEGRSGLAADVQNWQEEGSITKVVDLSSPLKLAEVLIKALFPDEGSTLEWNRITALQDVTIRLVAVRTLMKPLLGFGVYVQGEVTWNLPSLSQYARNGRKFHVYCSSNNHGAANFIHEMNKSLSGQADRRSSMRNDQDKDMKRVFNMKRRRQVAPQVLMTMDDTYLMDCECMLLYLNSHTWTSFERAIAAKRRAEIMDKELLAAEDSRAALEEQEESLAQVAVDAAPDLDLAQVQSRLNAIRGELEASAAEKANILKAYEELEAARSEAENSRTESRELTKEILVCMKMKIRLLLVHEVPGTDNAEMRCAVPFDTFFKTTPLILLRENVYSQIAIAVKGVEWRPASFAMVLRAIHENPPQLEDDSAMWLSRLISQAGTLNKMGFEKEAHDLAASAVSTETMVGEDPRKRGRTRTRARAKAKVGEWVGVLSPLRMRTRRPPRSESPSQSPDGPCSPDDSTAEQAPDTGQPTDSPIDKLKRMKKEVNMAFDAVDMMTWPEIANKRKSSLGMGAVVQEQSSREEASERLWHAAASGHSLDVESYDAPTPSALRAALGVGREMVDVLQRVNKLVDPLTGSHSGKRCSEEERQHVLSTIASMEVEMSKISRDLQLDLPTAPPAHLSSPQQLPAPQELPAPQQPSSPPRTPPFTPPSSSSSIPPHTPFASALSPRAAPQLPESMEVSHEEWSVLVAGLSITSKIVGQSLRQMQVAIRRVTVNLSSSAAQLRLVTAIDQVAYSLRVLLPVVTEVMAVTATPSITQDGGDDEDVGDVPQDPFGQWRPWFQVDPSSAQPRSA